MKSNGAGLKFADESFRKDKQIVLEAVKSNRYALDFADESLRNDADILKIIKKS